MSTLGFLVFTVFTIVFYKLVNWYLKRRGIFRKIEHFPGPKALPLIGNALEFKSCEDIIPTFVKYQKQYGMTYRVQLGPEPYVFTSDPKLLEAITSSSTQITKTRVYHFLKNWLGNGLVSASNPRWNAHRRMITPSFHFNILKEFLPIFQRNANNLVDHWKNRIGTTKEKQIDVFQDMSSCALDIIYETAMGMPIHALQDGKESTYLNSVRFIGRTVMVRSFSYWMRFDSLYRFTSWYKNEIECVTEIKATTEKIIKRKRAEIIANPDKYKLNAADKEFGTKKRMAFLDYLMAAENESGSRMTDEELREEIDTIVFTGHETTGVSSSYVLYYLAINQEVQCKLHEEIMSIPEKEITYDKLNSLKYLEMVIKESMRIMPTVPMFFRKLTDDVVYNGHHFPKGLSFGCFVYGAHRNPDLFEEPDKFIPERFTRENISKRHSFAYIPFSAGPRNCIGQKYAMVEMKAIIAVLLRHFQFSKASDVNIKPVSEGLLISQNGVQLIVEIRK